MLAPHFIESSSTREIEEFEKTESDSRFDRCSLHHSNVLIRSSTRISSCISYNPILVYLERKSSFVVWVKNAKEFALMVSCLRSIFYELLITRQRSNRANRSAVSNFFLLFVFREIVWNETENSLSRSWRIRFCCWCIEVNSVLPDIIARLSLVSSIAIRNMHVGENVCRNKRNVYQQTKHHTLPVSKPASQHSLGNGKRKNCFRD